MIFTRFNAEIRIGLNHSKRGNDDDGILSKSLKTR